MRRSQLFAIAVQMIALVLQIYACGYERMVYFDEEYIEGRAAALVMNYQRMVRRP